MPKVGTTKGITKKRKDLLPLWKRDTLEAKLCRMADKLGIHPKDLEKYTSFMRKFGIDPKQVTEHDLRLAADIDRMWQEDLKKRVLTLGGIWK